MGNEYDENTRAALKNALRALGASNRDLDWTIGGSQEIETLLVSIGGRPLTVESETYIGLTIEGDDDLVDTVEALVKEHLLSRKPLSG